MKPKHYVDGDLEPLKIIQEHNLPFELGNALKYIARCNHKGTKREDLEKAIDYLERYIENRAICPEPEDLSIKWQISDNLVKAAMLTIVKEPIMAIEFIKSELNNE